MEFFTGVVGDLVRSDQDPDCGAVPGVGRAGPGFAVEELPSPWRLRDRGRCGRGRVGQQRPDSPLRHGLLGLGSTPLRGDGGRGRRVGRAVGEITAEEVGGSAIGGRSTRIPADLQGSAAYRAKAGATMVARAATGDRGGKQCMTGRSACPSTGCPPRRPWSRG